ncbi:MAG: hypothetical protein AAFU53_01945 [Cyanobacteria bacterium J06632_3]
MTFDSTPQKDTSERRYASKSTEASTQQKRGRRRNRRQGFKPKRRGRPRHTVSGGSH